MEHETRNRKLETSNSSNRSLHRRIAIADGAPCTSYRTQAQEYRRAKARCVFVRRFRLHLLAVGGWRLVANCNCVVFEAAFLTTSPTPGYGPHGAYRVWSLAVPCVPSSGRVSFLLLLLRWLYFTFYFSTFSVPSRSVGGSTRAYSAALLAAGMGGFITNIWSKNSRGSHGLQAPHS